MSLSECMNITIFKEHLKRSVLSKSVRYRLAELLKVNPAYMFVKDPEYKYREIT